METSRVPEESEKNKEFLPGFENVNVFTQAILQASFQATKASNSLSSTEDEANYNRTFDAFRKFSKLEGKQVLKLMSSISQYNGCKVAFEKLDEEDIFEKLVEVNDNILEEAGTALDDAAGLRKKADDVVITTVRMSKPISTSWNRKTPSNSVYELTAAKNVQRPQLKFKDKIDNSKGPFIPILKDKPNSIKPLAILLEMVDDEEIYTHPYEVEIDKCQPAEEHLCSVTPQLPKPVEQTRFVFVDTLVELKKLCDDLRKCTIFAVDLEHHSYRTFQGITCLMQISTRQCDYIVDTLELRSELHVLNDVFTDPKILKVFHGANMDVQWLQRDLAIYIVNMFDTGQASAVLQFPHFSLAYLMKHYCQFEPDKQIRLGDWRIRPLPSKMLTYARDDTHYLLYIFDRMKCDLIEKGNEQKNLLLSVFQRSKDVCLLRYRKPYSGNDGHLNLYIKSKKMFNNRQLFALKQLFAWRDGLARMEDESIGYVLPNHMLLQIAEVLPREQQGILACCNPIPPLVRTQLNEIHQIILQARQASASKLAEPEMMTDTISKSQEYNEESNLNLSCPHDIPPHDGITVLSTLFDEKPSKKNKSVRKYLKEEPSLPIFGQNDSLNSSKTTPKSIEEVQAVLNTFVSPFERHKAMIASIDQEPELTKSPEKEQRIDRVHQHFKNLVESTPEEVVKNQNSDGETEVTEPIKTNTRNRKRKKPRSDTDKPEIPESFRPFDYNAAQGSNDQEGGPNKKGGRGKKRFFNPHEETDVKRDTNTSGKKRRGQKDLSITYGSRSSRKSQQNWPKR